MIQHDPVTPILEGLAHINGAGNRRDLQRALVDTQTHVRALRKAYGTPRCIAPYANAYSRAAYMLAYFPHYIEQVHFLLEELPVEVVEGAFGHPSITVAAFGNGPAPEVLGVVSYAREHYPNLQQTELCLLDAHNADWQTCLNLSLEILAPAYWDGEIRRRYFDCDLARGCRECGDLSQCRQSLAGASLLVVQNCLNDLEDPMAAANKIVQVLGRARAGSVLLALDVAFEHLRDAIRHIEAESVRLALGEVVVPVTDAPRCHASQIVYPKMVTNHLLTGEDGLIPKGQTRYYCSAIVRR